MRIIRDSKTISLPEDSTQRFFIQAWFSLVHMNSLDSHRVRCMNPINIIDELMAFLMTPKSNLPGIKEEIARTAAEVCEIINNDMIVQVHLAPYWQKLNPLLAQITIAKAKETPPAVFSYYLKDFQSELKKLYKHLIINAIRDEIFESKNHHQLFYLIGSLLSILIHDGHSIDELFSIVRNIFISNKSSKKFTFVENFEFVAGIINREPSQYSIVFKLKGCNRFEHLKSVLKDRISQTLELPKADGNVRKFLKPGQNVLFAKFDVNAQDDRSAALLAKKELDGVLDLIRFELENRVIFVDDNFISIRKNDDKSRIFRLPTIVPNPTKIIDPEQFEDFVGRFNRIFERDGLPPESKEKIRSALRFYRMGRDSDLFENKFLNWWTALEFLTKTGEKGSIIEEVISKLIPVLLLHYLEKHLLSFKNALLFCGIEGITEQISALEIFETFHDQDKFASVAKQIEDVPFLKFRIETFIQQTSQAKMLSGFIKKHETRIEWHLHRIWRVRCDIVHSAEYTLNLNLLSANLEYYLKSLLSLIIEHLTMKPGLGSIDELYIRYQYANERLHEAMKADNPDLHKIMLLRQLI